MKVRTVVLTASEISSILAQGGTLTFTPLHGNRLKCNQAPHLTRLSNKQAESLRAQVAGYRKNAAKQNTPRTKTLGATTVHFQRNFPRVRVWMDGDACCPTCERWRCSIHFTLGQPTICNYCQTTFIPISR